MSKRLKAERITERDRRIFQFLFEQKVATAMQIYRRFFKDAGWQEAYRRLLKLLKGNWLERTSFETNHRMTYSYSISEKAYEQFVLSPGINDKRKQLRSDSINHDLALVEIRFCMEQNTAVQNFIPENVLQSRQEFIRDSEFLDLVDLRSDAAVKILLQEKHKFLVPVEYEASLKSKDRCREKLLRYYTRYDGDAVFFICEDHTVLNRMVEIEREISENYEPKMYFSLLEDVKKVPTKLTFTRVQGDKYTIE